MGLDAGSVDQGNPPVTPGRKIPKVFSNERATPLRTDRKHVVDTSSFGNAVYRKRRLIVFAPANVTYEEIIKAMHPSLDYRFLRATSTKEDKYVYYPATMHANACTCSECKMKE